MKNTVVSVL